MRNILNNGTSDVAQYSTPTSTYDLSYPYHFTDGYPEYQNGEVYPRLGSTYFNSESQYYGNRGIKKLKIEFIFNFTKQREIYLFSQSS